MIEEYKSHKNMSGNLYLVLGRMSRVKVMNHKNDVVNQIQST